MSSQSRWTRSATVGAVVMSALASSLAPLAAQEVGVDRSRPWYVAVSHWGRWAALAGAGGLIGLAAARHGSANDRFDRLETLCQSDLTLCEIVTDPTGGGQRYAADEAEALWQDYSRFESGARSYLLGGQLTLVAAGAMFLIDLLYSGDEVGATIPLTPLELYTTPQRLGLALRF